VVLNFAWLTKPGGDFLNSKQTQENLHVWSEFNTWATSGKQTRTPFRWMYFSAVLETMNTGCSMTSLVY
jgi:hypothetical protein